MITYSQLGKNGRLGNQMFQYGTLFSVGFTRAHQIGIPKDQTLSKVFKLQSAQYVSNFDNKLFFKEEGFSFDPKVFLVPDNTELFGYFQSGRYFNHCEDVLRKEFEFLEHINEEANKFLQKFGDVPLCAVHVRRGDYANLSHYHTNLGSEYYVPACSLVYQNAPNIHFLVFSDDPEWCRQSFKDERFTIVETQDVGLDLCIMSKCHAHVIANSSFSWWGAWLSKSSAVIAPKQWFGPQGPKEWNSVYQQGWVLV